MPELPCPRLLLRPLRYTDAPAIRQYAGEASVAATTLNIPHPYPPDGADLFIAAIHDQMHNGAGYTFALTLTDGLIGCISLKITPMDNWAELGYCWADRSGARATRARRRSA